MLPHRPRMTFLQNSAFADVLARAVPHPPFRAKTGDFAVTKSSKAGLLPFPKRVRVDT
jgi:hypothetical protein